MHMGGAISWSLILQNGCVINRRGWALWTIEASVNFTQGVLKLLFTRYQSLNVSFLTIYMLGRKFIKDCLALDMLKVNCFFVTCLTIYCTPKSTRLGQYLTSFICNVIQGFNVSC